VAVPLIVLGVLYSQYGKEFLDRRVEKKIVKKEKAIEKKSEPPLITPPKKQTPILDGTKDKVVTKERVVEKKSKPPVTTAPKEQTPVMDGGEAKAIEEKSKLPMTTTPRKQNPILDGRVVAVRFFESGYGVLPRNGRIYKTDFRTSETRFVNWELSFEHPPPGSQIDYEIEVVCRRDGSVYMQKTTWARLEPGWTSSQHVSGWGSHNLGTWPMGAYRIELHVEGKKIAEGSFRIY